MRLLAGIICALLITGCSASAESEEVAERCEAVPEEVLASIEEGLTVSATLTNAAAVRSDDFEDVHMISAEFVGGGLDGDVGTWAKGGALTEPGVLIAVDGFAQEFSNYPAGDETDFDVTLGSDGAEASRSCVVTEN